MGASGIERTLRAAAHYSVLCLLYLAATILCVNAVMTRWGFLEDTGDRYGFEAMLQGRAERPWAYRVLTPATINFLSDAVSSSIDLGDNAYLARSSGVRERYFRGTPGQWTADLSLRYHVALALDALSLFLFLRVLRILPRYFGMEQSAWTEVGPICVAILLPLVSLNATYLYDFPELLLIGSCFLAAARMPWMLLGLVPLAAFNKETAILLPFILAPIIWERSRSRNFHGWVIIGGSVILSMMAYLLVRSWAAANPGSSGLYQLETNLHYWADPRSYFNFSMILGAGLPFPKLHTIVALPPLALMALLGWRNSAVSLRRSLAVALTLNVPLLLLFGTHDELRNLSLTFVPLYLVAVNSGHVSPGGDRGTWREKEKGPALMRASGLG